MSAEPKANRGPSAGPANRAALIAAAREVFAESGFAAPFSAVARRAGVGQGSLYRHFPDRVSLALAVFDENIAALEALAERPDATLSDVFDGITEQALSSTALIDMVMSERHDPRAERLAERLGGVVQTILERDRANGRIGDHVETEDVVLSISMLAIFLSRSDAADRPAAATRARALFRRAYEYRIDGQQAGA